MAPKPRPRGRSRKQFRRVQGERRAPPIPFERTEDEADPYGESEQEWEVSHIVDEDIDSFGVEWFEIKWRGWRGNDGKDTTWQDKAIFDEDNQHFLKKWQKTQEADLRKKACADSENIKIMDIAKEPGLFTSLAKWELEGGFAQKFKNLDQYPVDVEEILDAFNNQADILLTEENVQAKRSKPTRARSSTRISKTAAVSQRSSARGQHAPTSLASSEEEHDDDNESRPFNLPSPTGHTAPSPTPSIIVDLTPRRPQTQSSSSQNSSRASSNRPELHKRRTIGPKSKQKFIGVELPRPSLLKAKSAPGISSVSSSPSNKSSQSVLFPSQPNSARATPFSQSSSSSSSSFPSIIIYTLKQGVTAQWHGVTDAKQAAKVSFLNEVNYDDEPLPPGINLEFEYLEDGYIFDDGIEPPSKDFLAGCSGHRRCGDPSFCDCQVPSHVQNEAGHQIMAYDNEGLVILNSFGGTEIIVECNENCECCADCINRVAQKPRQIPIVIFKTEDHGWGVRSPQALPAGKILGFFTGKVIQRRKAARLPSNNFSFDLDHQDDTTQANLDERFSVDASTCGNWTRFINHSCSPNCKVVSVFYDTPAESFLPKLAFVTKRAVPAGTELTIDYEPQAQIANLNSKKGKGKIPDGAGPCLCRAENCRGYLKL
ncbi:SET domain-containing protein [Sistotremastrum niveocremeum HHB9708]|uniref:SET domain-containing protein n=1 Tax=Sistotremastrum niveocremeum HHB9708 TaxID=1314777 RepID=A0A164YAF1_9AGAM|nr:SET domain-containing protein [Sistotremastrum niveocremeum HHB9708]